MKIISDWFQRLFNDPQAVILTIVLVLGASVILFMGRDLAPVLASMVIAYLLEGIVQLLQHRARLPHLLAVIVVFMLFITFVLFLLLGLLPVSYTHLDVYKRQTIRSTNSACFFCSSTLDLALKLITGSKSSVFENIFFSITARNFS